MTDVELEVEYHLSISLVTYLSDIEWLTSLRQRNYMVSIPTSSAMSMISKRHHNGIFTSALVLKSDF